MNRFAFRAVEPNGRMCSGILDAPDLDSARATIAARRLFVLSVDARGPSRTRRHPISASDLALGLRVLGNLLESGLPVARALHAFRDLAPRGWRDALPEIERAVREGASLAAALAAAPIEIPAIVIGIAEAGEAGSGIGAAVKRAANLSEATAELHAAVRSALAYPAVVAAAGVSAVTVLITVVLPRFARILADLGQTLPPSTRLVLRVADTAHAAGVPLLIVAAGAFLVWRSWTRTSAGRTHWHRLLLATPLLGNLRRGAATARMARTLAALLESGVPITVAMTHAARATGDAELEARLIETRRAIAAGDTLSQALARTRAVSRTTVSLVRAGEDSGRLASMLDHAAKIEQQRADRIVRTGVRMLEPLLLLTFASVVALVAAALLQAIYSVRPTA